MQKFYSGIVMSTSKFQRYTLYPIKFPTLYEFYETQRDCFWVPKEVDLAEDVNQWRDTLTDEERHFITYVLAFFANADGIVLQNLQNNFSLDIDIPEANIFYGIQAGIEAIHWEMYSELIENLITDSATREKANNAILEYPCIKQKADWVMKWMNNDHSYLKRLVAFACTEGIFFSSSFASIFYLKKRGLMPGLCLSNKFIARDEGLHRDFACELFKVLSNNFPEEHHVDPEEVYQIVRESVAIEEDFVDASLDVDLIGLNSDNMKKHVRFMANHLLLTLGLDKIYDDAETFDWFDMISLNTKQNFFEGRVSEYQKVNTDKDLGLDTEEDEDW